MEEIKDDKRYSFKNKFEYEVKTYQDEITLLKMKMNEFNTLKLQHEESMERLQELYDMGLKNSNFEPADEINEVN